MADSEESRRPGSPAGTPGGSLRLAAALSALAGAVDAIGFLKLGGLFVAFMGGTSTQAAVFFILNDSARLLSAMLLVVLFVGGAAMGGVLAWAFAERRRLAMLSVTAGLLAAATLAVTLGRTGVAIALTVLAMGLQNVVLLETRLPDIGGSMITGTLAKLGEGLAQAATGRAGPEAWAPHLLLWLALVAGAAAGTALYAKWGALALAGPAFASLLLAIGHARHVGPAPAEELTS